LARTRKTAVRGIVEPRLRPSTAIVAVISAALGTMILYNIFLGQDEYPAGQMTAGSTHKFVTGSGKQPQSITLKYEGLVEDVQRELLATGHFQGLVDGVNGPRTKLAVEHYQTANGLAATGEVSKSLLEHIRYTRKIAQAADYTGSLAPVRQDAPQPFAAAQGNKTVVQLQERLARLGYDPGSRSGVLDDATKASILIFQMDHGLAMDGKITTSLLDALRKAEMQRASQ
jgi:peptidoglycan hydrolase-like protein with peptidoglycan-binding domain